MSNMLTESKVNYFRKASSTSSAVHATAGRSPPQPSPNISQGCLPPGDATVRFYFIYPPFFWPLLHLPHSSWNSQLFSWPISVLIILSSYMSCTLTFVDVFHSSCIPYFVLVMFRINLPILR
ncbi:Uncharacterised protein at_DN1929 [Pycnogonum litorale]